MIPTLDLLESRDCPSIGLPVVYDVPPFLSGPPPGALVETSTDRWQLAPALTQPVADPDVPWAPQRIAGEFDLAHTVFDVDAFRAVEVTVTRFSMPDALAVGILLHADGSLTVYQQTPGVLWSVTSTAEGWGEWQSVSLTVTAPVPSTAPIPFAFIESPDPWANWQWGDSVPDPVPETVYGLILASEGAVRIGFEDLGVRHVGVVTAGVLSIENVDEFWSQGEWLDEVEVW